MYTEGRAVIKYEKGAFLNPDARMSRDISVAFVAASSNRVTTVLDATAATGIRGIRYYLETPARKVTLLEMNKSALPIAKKNVALNRVKSKVLGKSIQEFANTADGKFDIIDLDPFGGVTPYVYDLMKISKNGTCLMITATDTAVLCGADYRACLRLYDSRPMHNEICHEVGLRILIGYVARVAAQFNFGVEALASFSYLHYMRIIIRLAHGQGNAAGSIKNIGYAHYCNKCLNRGVEFAAIPRDTSCKLCGNALETSGKVWLGRLYNEETLGSMKNAMLESVNYDKKSIGLVESMSEELHDPLYYSIPRITKRMGIGSVSTSGLIEMLRKKGYRASRTHMSSYGIKTNAGIKELGSCVRALSKGI